MQAAAKPALIAACLLAPAIMAALPLSACGNNISGNAPAVIALIGALGHGGRLCQTLVTAGRLGGAIDRDRSSAPPPMVKPSDQPLGAILSCVRRSKSLASWRSCNCNSGSPKARFTIRPRLTAGRASIFSAQAITFL